MKFIARLTRRWFLPGWVGQSEIAAMTRKEIAIEFVIPTAFAVAMGVVLALVLSALTFSG
jgi:hypothetical protein